MNAAWQGICVKYFGLNPVNYLYFSRICLFSVKEDFIRKPQDIKKEPPTGSPFST